MRQAARAALCALALTLLLQDYCAIAGGRCLSVADQKRCTLAAVPRFTQDCGAWDGAGAGDHKCSFHPLSHSRLVAMTNNTVVAFIGDSTSRRAAVQLAAMLDKKPFVDHKRHGAILNAVSNNRTHFRTHVYSYWFPLVDQLQEAMRRPNSTWARGAVNSELASARKIIVLHYSTWDLLTYWSHPDRPDYLRERIPRWVRGLKESVQMLLQSPGVRPERDVVLLRLPIAQACASESHIPQEPCDAANSIDPVNTQLGAVIGLLHAAFDDMPGVALIDAFSWTVAAPPGVGRHVCAPADEGGTHFGTDRAREAYIHQVMHAARIVACGRPEWEGAIR